MALKKQIELPSGIIVNYHRIVSINNITNLQINIEVASYTSEEKREEEKRAIEEGIEMNVFIDTNYHSREYIEDFNVEEAYEYLKTLPKFENAEDC